MSLIIWLLPIYTVFGQYCIYNHSTINTDNNCNGIIKKYVLLNIDNSSNISSTSYTYYDAKLACNTLYDTSLASIHSTRDYVEAKSLSSSINNNIWIGLNDNDPKERYSYDDGTQYDFDRFTNGNLTEDCVHISPIYNYTLNGYSCDGDGSIHYALCNIPSLLCSHRAEWTLIDGSYRYHDECDIILAANTDIILRNKQWFNGNKRLIIDYIYNMEIVIDELGDSGIMIYNSLEDTMCGYYYVYIQRTTQNNYILGVIYTQYSVSDVLIETNINFNYIESNYYLLSIHISKGNIFDIYLNDIHHISFDHVVNKNNVLNNGYSGYIGIKSSKYTNITAKSLYVSGYEVEIDDNLITFDCSSTTSNDPTHLPSPYPTLMISAHSNSSIITTEETILIEDIIIDEPPSITTTTPSPSVMNVQKSHNTEVGLLWLIIAILMGIISCCVIYHISRFIFEFKSISQRVKERNKYKEDHSKQDNMSRHRINTQRGASGIVEAIDIILDVDVIHNQQFGENTAITTSSSHGLYGPGPNQAMNTTTTTGDGVDGEDTHSITTYSALAPSKLETISECKENSDDDNNNNNTLCIKGERRKQTKLPSPPQRKRTYRKKSFSATSSCLSLSPPVNTINRPQPPPVNINALHINSEFDLRKHSFSIASDHNINTNSYQHSPAMKGTLSPTLTLTTPSPTVQLQLPKYQVTKRQWM